MSATEYNHKPHNRSVPFDGFPAKTKIWTFDWSLYSYIQTQFGNKRTALSFNEQKIKFIRISLVNSNKSTGNCGFVHIY